MTTLSEPPVRSAPALSALDVSAGMPLGTVAGLRLPRGATAHSPREALEGVLRSALLRSPCLLSFSGGRDSSALLGVATALARREGLPLPVPATLRFPGVAETDEEEWQLTVLRHLGLTDWFRFDVPDGAFDAIGPVATPLLLRHGLFWPFNTHFHQPIVAAATGGAVVTGFGGDELGRSSQAARAGRILQSRRLRSPRDALVVGLALAPRPVRAAIHRRRERTSVDAMTWLTRAGARRVTAAFGATEADIAMRWSDTLRTWFPSQRYFSVCIDSFAAMGADHSVEVFHPFVHGDVLSALAIAGGTGGYGTRTQLMQALFGDDLPTSVIRRATKGAFTSPVWTDTARTFAHEWSGDGVPSEWVDSERLRDCWLAEESINLLSAALLQAAWLHDATGRIAFTG